MPKQTSQKRELFASTLKKVSLGVFAVILLSIAWTTLRPLTTTAATNSYLNFQARLQTAAGAIVPDGNYNIEFKLYSASSGGSALWTEDYLNSASQGVRVANGFVTVNLGSITAFPTTINWDQQLWLTMNIGGTTTGVPSYDGEMTPRLQLTAVPYAFKAGQLAQANSGGTLFSTLSLQAPTVGNQVFQIQDQGAAGTYNLLTAPSGSDGYVKLQGGTPGTAQTGNLNISGTAIAGTLQSGTGGITDGGALTFSGSTTTTFTTPVGSSIATKINVPLYDPGAFNQIIALGLPASANTNARAITFLDARGSAHQPTIALLSPDETQIFGLSYDGSNTTAYVKASNASIGLQASGRTILSATYTSSTSGTVTIGDPTNVQGSLVFANSTNNAGVIVTSGVTSTQYTIQLPTAIGTAGQCLNLASVASAVETLGYGTCGGGGGFVSLQGSTPGTPDTGNLNISGVGIFGSGLQASSLDTPASSGTLSLGAANATTINIGGGTVSQTLGIGNGSGNDAINIGTGSGSDAITIGSSGDTISLGSAVTAISLLTNGGVTVGSSGGNGLLTNNGATVNTVLAVANLPTGGSIGTTSLTVDAYTAASVNQTTAGQTITIPTPTASSTFGRMFYVTNIGTVSFVMLGATINPGATATLVWANTTVGGVPTPAWTFAGTDKASIVNQTAQQTGASFNIDGTGTIGTSLTTPLVQSTGNLSIQAGSGSTINLASVGSSTNTTTVHIADTTAAVQTVTIGSTNTTSATTIQGGATGNINLVTGGTITLGTATNGVIFTPTTGITATGTAQHTKTIILPAEYAGAVLDASNDSSCSAANNGTMTSGFDLTNAVNYYKWTSNLAAQCYDVVVRVPIPADWVAWASTTPIAINTYSTNTSTSLINLEVRNSSGTVETSCNYVNVTPGSTSTWSNANSSNCVFASTTTGYSASGMMTLRLRLTGGIASDVRTGGITLSYKSSF